jgi:hypothetical protein
LPRDGTSYELQRWTMARRLTYHQSSTSFPLAFPHCRLQSNDIYKFTYESRVILGSSHSKENITYSLKLFQHHLRRYGWRRMHNHCLFRNIGLDALDTCKFKAQSAQHEYEAGRYRTERHNSQQQRTKHAITNAHASH